MGKLNEFHEANWRRMHEAFAPAHSPVALMVCVYEEHGELAAALLGVTGEKKRKAHLGASHVLDACADCATYLSLLIHSMGCELEDSLSKVRANGLGCGGPLVVITIAVYRLLEELVAKPLVRRWWP